MHGPVVLIGLLPAVDARQCHYTVRVRVGLLHSPSGDKTFRSDVIRQRTVRRQLRRIYAPAWPPNLIDDELTSPWRQLAHRRFTGVQALQNPTLLADRPVVNVVAGAPQLTHSIFFGAASGGASAVFARRVVVIALRTLRQIST
jgi:hypothetical protein